MSGNHTPPPWKISPGHVEGAVTVRQDGGEFQRPVAEVWHNGDDPKANAELIVTAVNSHASSQAEIERLRTALEPFVAVLENDIGQDETDADLYQPITHNRAPHITVGHLRAALAALLGSKE